MSRVLHSTALFCSERALLPKADINQSWGRPSLNKSRPVQNWSLEAARPERHGVAFTED